MAKKWLMGGVAILIAVSLTGAQVLAASPGGNQSQTHSHGSSETVTEDMLFTQEDIPGDYDVNSETQGDAEAGDYEKLFDTTKIQNVNIDIDENNWNYMLQNANKKPTVLTNSVTIGEETIRYAGIKTKGNLTLNSVWSSDSDRFSFTVNFGKFIKKKNGYSATQNFYGLSKVALNNIYGDATLMKEYLSYELMTAMGVATPKYCLINLSVNGEFWGVYMMVESIDSSLTQRTLGEDGDFLVKPEASGGDLVYDSALDQYLNGNGEFEFDLSDYPTSASNPLYKYNGLWENDEDTFADVKDMLPTVFKWMKTLNELSGASDPNTQAYQDALAQILNVDEVLRYFAANTYLVNLDSYQSEKMQNYGLYISEEGFASVLPWDYNYSFGVYGVGTAQAMINFNISNPVSNTTLTQRPLLNVLLQNDEYRALYERYLADCCIIAASGGTTSDGTSYAQGNFTSIINRYYETLKTTYADDPTAFYTTERYGQATQGLITLNTLRAQAVTRQLAGNTDPVETDLNLSTLGDVVGGAGGQPGGDGQPGDPSTLTDSATGISVSGRFPGGAALTVTPVTQGAAYTAASSLLSDVSVMMLFDISVAMPDGGGNSGAPDGSQGGIPSDGAGGTPPDGQQGGPQGDQTGMGQAMTVSIPVPDGMSASGAAVYRIDTDENTKALLAASVSDGKLIFTASELGLIAVTGTAVQNGDSSEPATDSSDKSSDDNSGSSAGDQTADGSLIEDQSQDSGSYWLTGAESSQVPQTGDVSGVPAILLFLGGIGGLTVCAVKGKLKNRRFRIKK